MNNHNVPDFEFQMDEEEEEEEEYPIPITSASKKPSTQNDEIMELLWQNGQVVLQSQNQRQLRKPPSAPERNTGAIPAEPSSAREVRVRHLEEAENYHNQHLFMQEDEMASWLHHYSIDEDPPSLNHHDFCADMLYAPPPPPNHGGGTAEQRMETAPRPPIPPARRIQNFAHFSTHGGIARVETAPPASLKVAAAAALETMVMDSCETPATTAAPAVSMSSPDHGETRRSVSSTGRAASSAGGRETATCEMTVTLSPAASSGSAEPVQRKPVVDRKRKGREPEESEFQSEDVDFESPEAKKQVRGSTSTKRSRAAEVHNLSERRRRDRINEKMRALQELIPRCNKSDKASMLDEAIEYLKSLQLQVQMMSMGCGMVPMMFPGIQQYMPPVGMGIGMGMGMEMGMNIPVMPFPNMLASSALPASTSAAHLGARFPMPPFQMPHVPTPDSSRMQAPNQSDNHNMLTSLGTPDGDQSRLPNFTDSHQQYFGSHQMHLHLMQAMNQQNATKPSTTKGQQNPEKHQPEET